MTNIIKSDQLAEVEITYRSKVKASERKKIISSANSYEVLKSVWSNKMEYVEEVVILLLNRRTL